MLFRSPFRCTGPSNHARRANLATPPAPPNSASARNPCVALAAPPQPQHSRHRPTIKAQIGRRRPTTKPKPGEGSPGCQPLPIPTPSRRSAKPLECPTAPKLGPEADVTRPHSSAPNRPSARNSSAVCVLRRRTAAREPPVLDHPIREARSRRLHPIDSWAVGIASSSHGIAAALCRHQPVACRS